MKKSLFALVLLVLTTFASTVKADEVYTYTGKEMTCACSITGSFTTPDPIDDTNGVFLAITPTFTFAADGQVWHDVDSVVNLFEVNINAQGFIQDWLIDIGPNPEGFQMFTNDTGQQDGVHNPSGALIASTGQVGSWSEMNTIGTITTSTPEPGSFLLLALGAGSIFAFKRFF